jgi:hypothetical protein
MAFNREELEGGLFDPAYSPADHGTPPKVTRRRRTAEEPPPVSLPEVIDVEFREEEPKPGPSPEPPPVAPPVAASATPPADQTAGEAQGNKSMTLAQQIAMLARQLNIERKVIVFAVTGKERASEVDRAGAGAILEALRDIRDGKRSLTQVDGVWSVIPSEPADLPEVDEGMPPPSDSPE